MLTPVGRTAPMIFWLPLIASLLHITEEFVFPGGFPEWDRSYRPAIKASITPRLHIIINGLLLLLGVQTGLAGGTPVGVALWLTLAALLASNAVWHLVGSIKMKNYSPGVVTGWVLYVPMAIYGYAHFVGGHEASLGTAVAAAVLGGSYHVWAAIGHRRRASGTAK